MIASPTSVPVLTQSYRYDGALAAPPIILSVVQLAVKSDVILWRDHAKVTSLPHFAIAYKSHADGPRFTRSGTYRTRSTDSSSILIHAHTQTIDSCSSINSIFGMRVWRLNKKVGKGKQGEECVRGQTAPESLKMCNQRHPKTPHAIIACSLDREDRFLLTDCKTRRRAPAAVVRMGPYSCVCDNTASQWSIKAKTIPTVKKIKTATEHDKLIGGGRVKQLEEFLNEKLSATAVLRGVVLETTGVGLYACALSNIKICLASSPFTALFYQPSSSRAAAARAQAARGRAHTRWLYKGKYRRVMDIPKAAVANKARPRRLIYEPLRIISAAHRNHEFVTARGAPAASGCAEGSRAGRTEPYSISGRRSRVGLRLRLQEKFRLNIQWGYLFVRMRVLRKDRLHTKQISCYLSEKPMKVLKDVHGRAAGVGAGGRALRRRRGGRYGSEYVSKCVGMRRGCQIWHESRVSRGSGKRGAGAASRAHSGIAPMRENALYSRLILEKNT
ncbi:hypothetical protein EVAR_70020_1 [Eumeta japonica]|uniref:Uncharacterized protein n=1 Tax=Eumeta variegata TaxID=151549 RepID=A0A4C2AEH6_EUMVA|nr:hypothetical protein EVAR_70020_1 [Eumeta japonica]